MVTPEWVVEAGEKFRHVAGEAAFPAVDQRADFRPAARELGQGGESALRVVCRADADELPGVGGEGKALQRSTLRPPVFPAGAEVIAGRFVAGLRAELRRVEEAAQAQQEGRRGGWFRTENFERQPLHEEREGKFVFLVAQRDGEGLEERLIVAAHRDETLPAAVLGFQPVLRGGGEERVDFFAGQIAQGRVAAPELGGRKRARRRGAVVELAAVELHLSHLTMLRGAREGLAFPVTQVEVEDHVVEGGIRAVTVAFPVLGAGVEFDGAAHGGSTGTIREADRRVREIGTRLVVPDAELDDFHAFAGGGGEEVGAEIARKPVRLELQFSFVAAEAVGGSLAEHAVRGGQEGGVAMGEIHERMQGEGRRMKAKSRKLRSSVFIQARRDFLPASNSLSLGLVFHPFLQSANAPAKGVAA